MKNEAVSFSQYRNWESQILEKIDIAMNRNYKKVESIFADKLNSFKMVICSPMQKMDEKFLNVKQNNKEIPASDKLN